MVDERPKPKYGELAPEGWTWQPPAPPANDSDVPAPLAETRPSFGGSPQQGQVPPAYGATRPPTPTKPLNVADVAITSFLLFVGIVLSASMIPTLFDFGRVLNQAAAAQGYGTITPSAAANAAGAIIGVVTIILQLLAIVWSVRRLQRRRLAAPVVIVIGIVTFVLWIAVIVFAFFSDPVFLQQVMSTAHPATPA